MAPEESRDSFDAAASFSVARHVVRANALSPTQHPLVHIWDPHQGMLLPGASRGREWPPPPTRLARAPFVSFSGLLVALAHEMHHLMQTRHYKTRKCITINCERWTWSMAWNAAMRGTFCWPCEKLMKTPGADRKFPSSAIISPKSVNLWLGASTARNRIFFCACAVDPSADCVVRLGARTSIH